MVGGEPFGLKPGQWTDDTSLALCLAASLIEGRGFDAHDQMQRYVKARAKGPQRREERREKRLRVALGLITFQCPILRRLNPVWLCVLRGSAV
jgi:ADP-ribosylglycohydrolase